MDMDTATVTSPTAGLAPIEPFLRLRPRLFGIAYRMLGTRADAEDIVQEAWLRWQNGGSDDARTPEAWLVTVVTRLAIDRLRGAQTEREHYVGPGCRNRWSKSWWSRRKLLGKRPTTFRRPSC